MAQALEMDERFFVILAQCETAAIVRHIQSGKVSVWRKTWREKGEYFNDADAWASYMKEMTNA